MSKIKFHKFFGGLNKENGGKIVFAGEILFYERVSYKIEKVSLFKSELLTLYDFGSIQCIEGKRCL